MTATAVHVASRTAALASRGRSGSALWAGVPITLATIGCFVADATITVAVLVLMPIVTLAAVRNRSTGVMASILGTGSISFFFTPPELALSLGKTTEDALVLVVFLGVSTLVSTVVDGARRAEQTASAALMREAEARARSQVDAGRAAFFAAAGHNLRTPLAGVRAAAEALAQGGGEPLHPRDAADLLEGIIDEVDRLERLVGRVLLLSRATTGTAAVEPIHGVDIPDLVGAVVARVDRAMAPAVRWAAAVQPGPPGLAVDPVALEQVLQNLLENAARHAPPGTEVRVEGRPAGPDYRIAVADAGPGIPPEERERVFEPFHSDQRRKGGSGLGLAIVRGLVAAHGGTVAVEEGPGTTIALHLPIAGPA